MKPEQAGDQKQEGELRDNEHVSWMVPKGNDLSCRTGIYIVVFFCMVSALPFAVFAYLCGVNFAKAYAISVIAFAGLCIGMKVLVEAMLLAKEAIISWRLSHQEFVRRCQEFVRWLKGCDYLWRALSLLFWAFVVYAIFFAEK